MARLRSGAQQAHGGKRAGSGRKPDWLKTKCADLVDRNKLLEFVASVANGDETETHYDKEGNAYEGAATIKDRLHAVEMLLERGYGKPAQSVELSGAGGVPLVIEYVSSNKVKGPGH
jgi:protease II